MAIPTQGKQYTVTSGDTLERIAIIAYGDKSKWRKIYNANQTTLRGTSANDIFPGEILIIPKDKIISDKTKEIKGVSKDSFIVKIDDREILITEGSFIKTMDTASDAWTIIMPWIPGQDTELDELTKPYNTPKSEIYIGGKLKGTGKLYTVANGFSSSGRTKILSCFSLTADLIDSTLKPPYEFKNVDLEQHAIELCKPFGIEAIFNDSAGGKFDKITADKKDTVFSHLKKYAFQRSLLMSCDEFGNLVFQKADTDQKSVGTISEDEQNTLSWSATFDGRKRFNSYRVISQTPGGNAKTEIVKDNSTSGSRFTTIDAPDLTKGAVKDVAEWARSKALTTALTNSFPQAGWYAPNGDLWEPNTKVSVTSITLGLPNGKEMMIKRVKFDFKDSGISSSLDIVPPEVFTGDSIDDIFS